MSPASAAETGRRPREDGSAVVDFVLVGALTTLLAASVLQLMLALHVRTTLIDCAAEGARYAAFADRDPAQGAARTRELIATSLSAGYAGDVTARSTVIDGLPVIEVQVTAPLPLLGLLGPTSLTVRGHGLEEAP